MPETIKKAIALEELKNVAQRTQTQVASVTQKMEDLKTSVPKKVSELTNDSKFQTDVEVAAAVAAADHLKRKKVDSVSAIDPAAEGADKFIYMVPKTGSDADDLYDEYMVMDGKVEHVGNTKVDLSGYQQTEDGKGLSANDYTDEAKAKLDGVAEGATKVEAGATPGSIKVNGTETPVVTFATDAEVNAMLDEVFGAEPGAEA